MSKKVIYLFLISFAWSAPFFVLHRKLLKSDTQVLKNFYLKDLACSEMLDRLMTTAMTCHLSLIPHTITLISNPAMYYTIAGLAILSVIIILVLAAVDLTGNFTGENIKWSPARLFVFFLSYAPLLLSLAGAPLIRLQLINTAILAIQIIRFIIDADLFFAFYLIRTNIISSPMIIYSIATIILHMFARFLSSTLYSYIIIGNTICGFLSLVGIQCFWNLIKINSLDNKGQDYWKLYNGTI